MHVLIEAIITNLTNLDVGSVGRFAINCVVVVCGQISQHTCYAASVQELLDSCHNLKVCSILTFDLEA